LLSALRTEPFFTLPPPKSTGRDLFNPAWLQAKLDALPSASNWPAQDVQATLAELAAWSCAEAVQRHAADARQVLVCGGGAFNQHLMHRLAARLPGAVVGPTDTAGLPASQVEAAAFAWLAKACIERRPGNLASVTGAAGPRVLGAVYPAH
jgi:anhydro-N-acetylmuramic acid kinase